MQQKTLEYLGPCGINCQKCFAFKDGSIKYHSENLRNSLGNFDIYAKRFTELLDAPVFSKYSDFKGMLDHFANANCNGCRKQECHLFRSCNVRICHKEKSVDFCFQCKEFPCNRTGFDTHLEQRWIKINQRMKEVGVEEYYNEIKDKARY
ncbi:MAG: DUF3795 domain-containing protein [Bacteroidales bacterium]|nr:MAG: DUF3795 domain-containing protein [Bacteroidales bacterium]